MKNIIITVLVLISAINCFSQTDTVNAMYANGRFGKKKPVNHLVAKTPLAITTGGGTDTVGCTTCATGTSISGSGTATRIGFWRSSTALSSGANINIDSTNSRIGFLTTVPTHTMTFDSTAARASTSGFTSTGGGGISFYYTTNQTSDYKRAHIYASGNGLAIMANQYNGTATFFPLTLNHTSCFVNSNGQLSSVGINSSSTITGNGDFTTSGASAFFNSNNYSAIANNSAMRFRVVTQNQSAGDLNGVWIDATAGQSQTGTTSFSIFKIGYNSTSTGSGKYSLINLGSVSGSNFVTGWRVFTNYHTVIGDSVDNGEMLRVNGSFATAYIAKTANYTATGADQTINFTSGTDTLTLPTAVSITGRRYTIVNSGSGTCKINTTSSQTFVNINTAPTILTLNPVGAAAIVSYTVMSNGANWIVIDKVKDE